MMCNDTEGHQIEGGGRVGDLSREDDDLLASCLLCML